jgi:hypothetical protein
MMYTEFRRGPFGLDANQGGTMHCERTVLVAVQSTVTGSRLADLLDLLGPDRRIQMIFTPAPANSFGG